MRELFNLAVGEKQQQSVNTSDHLAISDSDVGLVRVIVHLDNNSGDREYELGRGDSIGPLPLFSAITVSPVESGGAFVVVPTMGRFTPSADGAEVVINGEVNMTADTNVGLKADANTVKIDPVANVVQLSSNTVKIDPENNAVALADNVVRLDATGNTVKIDPTQNTVKLNTDQIGIDPNKNLVRIDGSINVGTVSVGSDSVVNGIPQLVWSADGTKQIATNADRGHLYLMADEGNTGPVWLASNVAGTGIPLAAGQGLEIPVSGTISFYANSGQKLYAMETE